MLIHLHIVYELLSHYNNSIEMLPPRSYVHRKAENIYCLVT